MSALLMIIGSMAVFGYSNLDYSNPQDYWVDLVLSLNQSGNNLIFGNITTENIYPTTTLTYDIGSGPLRWRYLYVADISADDIDVSGDVTATTFYGDGASLTGLNVSGDVFINGTNVSDIFVNEAGDTMTGPLLNTDGTYIVTINGTTISSDTYYSPLMVLGGGSSATGNNAIAAGISATATGNYCMAFGNLANCNSASGMAIGSLATAGYRSFAGGYQSQATGGYSTAFGWASTATADYATAIGLQSQASGIRSLAMGSYSKARGLSSVSIGAGTDVTGNFSYAFGDNITVSGMHSFGLGEDGVSTANNTITLHNLNMVVDRNITANTYYGDGSQLTGISASGSGTDIDQNVNTTGTPTFVNLTVGDIKINGTSMCVSGSGCVIWR